MRSRFDPENIGYVTSELFLKRLGLMNNSNSPNDSNNSFQESSSIPSANVSGKLLNNFYWKKIIFEFKIKTQQYRDEKSTQIRLETQIEKCQEKSN